MAKRHWTPIDRYLTDLLVAPDPALDDGARGQRGGRAAGHQRLAEPGQAAPPAGPGHRRAQHPGDRHARRLQHHLAGAGAAARRPADHPRGRRPPRRGRPRQHRPRRTGRSRRGAGRGRRWSTLPKLAAEGGAPFDFVFIDADKPNNAAYFEWALRLSRAGQPHRRRQRRPRRRGRSTPTSDDPDVQGVRRFLERLAAEPRVERHRDPDRRQQGLRRVRHRAGVGAMRRCGVQKGPALRDAPRGDRSLSP